MEKNEMILNGKGDVASEDTYKAVRGYFVSAQKQVMLDSDLAMLYQVETKVFNQAVSRNIERFPENFRFQLTKEEFDALRSQIATSNGRGGRRYRPYMFTEQGIAMLSGVLRSDVAVQVSIRKFNLNRIICIDKRLRR